MRLNKCFFMIISMIMLTVSASFAVSSYDEQDCKATAGAKWTPYFYAQSDFSYCLCPQGKKWDPRCHTEGQDEIEVCRKEPGKCI